jgi:hypothetical protein
MRQVMPHPAKALVFIAVALEGMGVSREGWSTDAPEECIGANATAQVRQRDGKFADAKAELAKCVAAACPQMVRDDCAKRLDELERLQPTIVFDVRDETGGDLSAVRVSVDGHLLVDRLDGTALAVDPGDHMFTFDAEGRPSVSRRAVLKIAERERRERIVFQSPASLARIPVRGPQMSPTSEGDSGASRGLGTQKTLALAAAGLGVIGMAVGSAFGLKSLAKHDDASRVCPIQCTDQPGVGLWQDARTAGNTSTLFFVAGAVAIAGGVVLWFTAPGPRGIEARIGTGLGVFAMQGTW